MSLCICQGWVKLSALFQYFLLEAPPESPTGPSVKPF